MHEDDDHAVDSERGEPGPLRVVGFEQTVLVEPRGGDDPRPAPVRVDLVPGGPRWEGHEGATRFYTQLLTAFPDIHFALQTIVIGPQGVFEQAHVTATHERDYLSLPASGERIEFETVIYFPWDPEKRKFRGEQVLTVPSFAG